MKLYGIYSGLIKSINNAPCKIAVFTDGNKIKVFEKVFFRNAPHENWSRNVCLEGLRNTAKIEKQLLNGNFTKIK